MADIVFCIAPIGGGKSWYSTRAACYELRLSGRNVVTNLPIYEDECPPGQLTVSEWCHKYVKEPVDIRKRFRKLTRDEVFEFWRYLPGRNIANVERPDGTGKMDLVPDLQSRQNDPADCGTFYLIDEVHLYFSARSWGVNGVKVETYMSQLRKLNDDLFLITQHPEKVDKNFRRNATEWLYLKNMGRTRLWGGVSLPGQFRFERYDSMPNRGDKPLESGSMRLKDEEFHKVYDTMSGVGLTGKLMPEQSRVKGGHWSRWVAIGACLVLCAFLLPHLFGFAFGRMTGMAVASTAKGFKAMIPQVGGPGSGQYAVPGVSPAPLAGSPQTDGGRFRNSMPASFDQASRSQNDYPYVEDAAMTGYANVAGEWLVALSDGRTLRSSDPRFENLTPEGVKFAGRYYLRALVARPARPVDAVDVRALPGVSGVFAGALANSASAVPGRPVDVHWQDGTVTHHHLTQTGASVTIVGSGDNSASAAVAATPETP
jgi:hypothetical protein